MEQKAKNYLNAMESAIGDKLINPNLSNPYSGQEGHKRLAREMGVALNDFNEEERKEITSVSYGKIYVKGCNLKPIMDSDEWISTMMSQVKVKA